MVVCCTRDTESSIDFHEDERHRMKTYDGLETCILNSQSYLSTNADCVYSIETFEEHETSCSSSKDACGTDGITKRDDVETHEWNKHDTPDDQFCGSGAYVTRLSDVDAMKETFSKLLLGQDITGGCKGKTSALAISNAISNLAASVYGELWKLEPLSKEGKAKWIKEMNWLLSPANYMVELVPAKQSGSTFEVMVPKARADVHMNIPALQKIDSMLIEVLDSMVSTEFWYTEVSNGRQSKRWWLPYPRVPATGLSETARKKLLSQGNVVHQVFKAAKTINENVLLEMTVPKAILDALPTSGRANLGEELYRIIASESNSNLEMVESLTLRTEHDVLDTINKLETASLVWKNRITQLVGCNKTPMRSSAWSFAKESSSEVSRIQSMLLRVDVLLYQLRARYPCLPHTFLDMTKIQYGQDVGHAIIEAYSRVLGNLAYKILTRIRDILQEDYICNPNSPILPNRMSDDSAVSISGIMHRVAGYFTDSNPSRFSDSEISLSTETKTSSVTATPSFRRIWRSVKDATTKGSPVSPWL